MIREANTKMESGAKPEYGIDAPGVIRNLLVAGVAAIVVLKNAELERVSGKIEVVSGDATEMKFPDASFDVVVSNLCIHNIPAKEGRGKACREIVQVLKTGGKLVISDLFTPGSM
jgi:SAM-dependent methyltransferase